ncbi:MAG: sugar phosphate nucleotidyltransferase [Solirubrobacteraceae bacterium]|nr:sugar phosphate nucleotidyltransferase [Solirubrobacteraceae bacterium]
MALVPLNPETPVGILCGGRGLRLGAHDAPKPLVPIGGRPVLGHVIDIYVAQGARRFVLLGGHRVEEIRAWVGTQNWPDDVHVDVLDTGEDTPTGGRVLAAAESLTDGPGGRFHLTYADGVADLDLASVVARHEQAGGAMTVTVVRPELNFGVADLDEAGMVTGFREKPIAEFSVNGGFMVCEPEMLDLLRPDSVLEGEPFEQLAASGQLAGAPHSGFWACMDTPKDLAVLEARWAEGAPWRPTLPAHLRVSGLAGAATPAAS